MLTFGFYFAFVSGLTIGYGDLAPKSLLTRTLAVLIGICGVLVTALVAAVAVKALTAEIGRGCVETDLVDPPVMSKQRIKRCWQSGARVTSARIER
jgi:hypothetical protein